MKEIVPDMPPQNYHSFLGLSASGLKQLWKSPAHFRYWRDNPTDPTPDMVLGTCAHTLLLEPHKSSIAVFDGRRKQGKAWDEFKAAHDGDIILSPDDFEAVNGMVESVRNHPIAGNLLDGALCEESVFWTEPTYGIRCKCRPDIRRLDFRLLADLKTCQDASPEGFSRQAVNFGYDIQAAWYLAGINTVLSLPYETFLFIAVEKKPPHLCAVYNARNLIEPGLRKIRAMLPVFKECSASGNWPGYVEDIIDLELPRWAQ